MELSDLNIFLTVIREGSITRAAEALHRVQSNVTTRIRKLEDDLGKPLFIREGKKLWLTADGLTLQKYAEQLLGLAAEARAAVCDPVPGGVFRLGAMESTASIRLPPVLVAFSRRFPSVQLDLTTGNPSVLTRMLLTGDVHAAIIAGPITHGKLAKEKVFREEAVIITGKAYPDLANASQIPRTMIVLEHGCPHRALLERWYTARNNSPERIVELGSYHAIVGCVAAGMGAALLPASVLEAFPGAEHVKTHKLPTNIRWIDIYFTWLKLSDSPNIQAFLESLRSSQSSLRSRR